MKNIISQTLLLLALVTSIGCGSLDGLTGGGDPFPKASKPNYRKPTASAKVYKPVGEWQIRNESDLADLKKIGATVKKSGSTLIVDLKGNVIDGSKQRGSGGQSENQTPLFRARVPLKISNGFVINNKNAATFYAPNSEANKITWDRIGEDALATADNAKNFTVRNCQFIGGKSSQDKLLQLNEAAGAKVEDNLFYGAITGARIGKHDFVSSNDRATCSNNRFIAVDTAWNVGKMQLSVIKKNKYDNVRLPFKTSNGGKISNADGTVEND